jgi:hypothetical protein
MKEKKRTPGKTKGRNERNVGKTNLNGGYASV